MGTAAKALAEIVHTVSLNLPRPITSLATQNENERWNGACSHESLLRSADNLTRGKRSVLAKFRRIYLVISLLSTIYMVRTQPDFFEKILNETNARLNPELAKIMSDNYQVPEVHFAPRVPKTPEEVQSAQVMNDDVQDYLRRAAAASTESTQVAAPIVEPTPEPPPPEPAPEPPPRVRIIPKVVASPIPEPVAYEISEEALEPQTSEAKSIAAPAPSPIPQLSARVETAVVKFESRQVPTQFLYFKIRNHLVRFNVDEKIDDKTASKLIAILKTSCISTSFNESGCEVNKRNTVIADKGFFADVENSEKEELPLADDAETVWKLICADGSLDCLNSPAKFKSFKLLLTKAGLTNHVLARGFESQRVRASAKRMPSSMSSTTVSKPGFSNIEKVFTTKTLRTVR